MSTVMGHEADLGLRVVVLMGRGWRSWGQEPEVEAQDVPTDVCKHLMGVKKAEPGSSQRHRGQWAQAEVQEIPFTCQKMLLFYCKGGLSPEQAAQQGCEGATPGDVPNPIS